jgi:hypothetical protein
MGGLLRVLQSMCSLGNNALFYDALESVETDGGSEGLLIRGILESPCDLC